MSTTPIKEIGRDTVSQSAEQLITIGGDPRPGHFSTPITTLPEEIFIKIVRLSINTDTQVRDLFKLTTVCRLWKRILEGAPALWTVINAAEGLGCLQKALRMAQSALLYIQFGRTTPKVSREAFFQAVRGRRSQWKSLLVLGVYDDWPQCISLAGLESTAPPQLERLHLIHFPPEGPSGDPITIFGGVPAPASLKDVQLERVPIAVAPLRLSGLTTLVLANPPHVPLREIIRVLNESPALQTLHLSWGDYSVSQDREPAHTSVPEGQNIHLTCLRSLILKNIPISILRPLLAILRIPNTEAIHLTSLDQKSPIPELFTADLNHLLPILLRITSAVDRVHISFYKNHSFSVVMGRFQVYWKTQLEHVPVFFEWIFPHMEAHLKELPTTIYLHKCAHRPSQMEWFSSNLNVTELELYSDALTGPDSNELLPFLSRPVTMGSQQCSSKWLFPELEVIRCHFALPQDMTRFANMVQERYSVADEDTMGVTPKPFRKIWLAYGGPAMFVNNLPIDKEALKTIQMESKDADIYWAGEEWTGS